MYAVAQVAKTFTSAVEGASSRANRALDKPDTNLIVLQSMILPAIFKCIECKDLGNL